MSAKTGHPRIVWRSAASVNNASALALLSAQAAGVEAATTARAPLGLGFAASDSAPPAVGGATAAFALGRRAAGGIAAQAQCVFSRKRTGRARKRASVLAQAQASPLGDGAEARRRCGVETTWRRAKLERRHGFPETGRDGAQTVKAWHG